jgi:hypothetical protein
MSDFTGMGWFQFQHMQGFSGVLRPLVPQRSSNQSAASDSSNDWSWIRGHHSSQEVEGQTVAEGETAGHWEYRPSATTLLGGFGTFAGIYAGGPLGGFFGRIIRGLAPANQHPSPSSSPTDPIEILRRVAEESRNYIDATQPGLTPWQRGGEIHREFARRVEALGAPFASEETYIDGKWVRYGFPFGVRADAIVGDPNHPTFAIELKTWGGKVNNYEAQAYFENLPVGTTLVGITERNY